MPAEDIIFLTVFFAREDKYSLQVPERKQRCHLQINRLEFGPFQAVRLCNDFCLPA